MRGVSLQIQMLLRRKVANLLVIGFVLASTVFLLTYPGLIRQAQQELAHAYDTVRVTGWIVNIEDYESPSLSRDAWHAVVDSGILGSEYSVLDVGVYILDAETTELVFSDQNNSNRQDIYWKALTEYASNKKVVGIIEYAAETLSGIPSIIYGLVGMLLFSNSMGTCLMAGALTLVIMNLPTIMRTTQESLKTVPQSYREGAFGLGAGKWRVVRTVVLPECVDGVITGCILSVGRILGESAALLFTAGFAHTMLTFPLGMKSPGATLTVALYVYAKEQGEFGVAFVQIHDKSPM